MMKLQEMDLTDFKKYLSTAAQNYAKEKVSVGTWLPKDALEKAQTEFKNLLPNGLKTPENYLFNIINEQKKIGFVWIARYQDGESAFIYDFEIYTAFQNQGLGTQAMQLIFVKVKELGFKTLNLHVFGNNERAAHVYKKCGFYITDISMQRDL